MRRKKLLSSLIILLSLIWLVAAPPARQAQKEQGAASFDKSVQPFLSKNCHQCHNSDLKTGGLNLEAYKTAETVTKDREKWERILQKLRGGEMPPKGMPRPNEEELKAVIGWIEGQFERLDGLIRPDPGRVTARRLNRAEYNNTVRDLLGIDLRLADDFPQDDSGYGFDNIGDVLSLSPVLMEKYMDAAEKIARTALFGIEPLKATLVQYRPSGRQIAPIITPLIEYDVTGLTLPNSVHATHRFPVTGEYVIRVVAGGERPGGSEPIQIALWLDGKQVEVADLDPDAEASFSQERQELWGKTRQFRLKIAAGNHWLAASVLHLYDGLPPQYGGHNPSRKPPPQFKPPVGAAPERVEMLRKRFEAQAAEKIPPNQVRISYVEVGGPYEQVKGPSDVSLKRVYTCGHLNGGHQSLCARKIVAGLARRAYRRQVTPQEVDRLVSLVSLARQQGGSFEEAISLALEAMLISPHFLFRIEKVSASAGNEDARSVSPHDLASRLSYFLWSSMPDDELLRLADQRALGNPAVLAAQVRRMLVDPRSRALVENFGGQWLELRRLDSVKPDRQRFPAFDEYLRMSMRQETEMFFDNIVREDRSILDFIDGKYTFLNERLAQFYGIAGVKGPEFRKVLLIGNKQRSGILTQAGILTVSSYATRTSPVLRGKWILENILNAPPPPPPPDVPNLNESIIGESASLRQQMEAHRKQATCASCHARMDPLGFGLENYDAIGAWRTRDKKITIDPSGALPDGRTFQGSQELKNILKADREAFAECLTEKLLTYALGRGLERFDKPTVRKIANHLAADNYRFYRLALEIVKSLPFQNRRREMAR
jgi:mono/diheme cytochrome c family protein